MTPVFTLPPCGGRPLPTKMMRSLESNAPVELLTESSSLLPARGDTALALG